MSRPLSSPPRPWSGQRTPPPRGLGGHLVGRWRDAEFAFQRRTARRLGMPRARTGAVAFVQRFGSALQLTLHLHVLLPEAVFEKVGEGTTRLVPLPPPSDGEVERLAATVARRVPATLRARGVVEQSPPPRKPSRSSSPRVSRFRPPVPRPSASRSPLCLVEGLSLQANTWLHENDVFGLERLSELLDGRFAYQMKRPSPLG